MLDFATLDLDELYPVQGDHAYSDVNSRIVIFISGFNGARYEFSQDEFVSTLV